MTDTHLAETYTRYSELLSLAESYNQAGDLPAAVGLAQIAVRYIFPGKGLFASPRLEKLLLQIGKQIPTGCCRKGKDKSSRHVLHVLTHARPIGGDSRFAWRWIQRDCSSKHSVAITTQADVKGLFDIPRELSEGTKESGGFLQALSAPTSNPLEQARELRGLCQDVDVVVLHLFPYDLVPVLALAAGCETPKVLFVHHSDHTFWIGASVAHRILHLRKQPTLFLRNRRGLDLDKSSLLPIPLGYAPPAIARADAKRALGYDPEKVLLLTIATPFKYSSPGQISFLDLVTPVVVQCPRAVLIAVGPEPEGAWRSAKLQTDGRILALGTRWDNDLLYAAADVYLDSVPFSSSTSLLEAGSIGLPLLGYCLQNSELELLGPGAPGLDGVMQVAKDVESYRTLLARLIRDPEFRASSGHRIQESILSVHDGSKWLDSLNEAYRKVESADGTGCLADTKDSFECNALNEALAQLYGQLRSSVRSLTREYVGALSYFSRFSITWRLYRIGLDLCFLNLLPPPADTIVHSVGRRVKKILQRARLIR